MPHNIGEMFYFGDRPWHGLGNRIEQPANIEQALKVGDLDWDVDLVPIVPAGEPLSSISHRVAVVRRDRVPGEKGRAIGVVHPGYRPLQNRIGAKLFDDLLGQGQNIYHTGGYLKNGEVVWLLAKFPEDIRVGGKDILETYLLFTNSHDGSMAIDIRLTTVRVVCNNTLTLALEGYGVGKVFRRGHNGSAEVIKTEAKEFFKFAAKQSRKAEELFTRLANTRCAPEDFQNFLVNLMPDPSRPRTADGNNAVRRAYETRMETIKKTRKQVYEVHLHGITSQNIEPAESTWWGALNSITAWVDHIQQTESDRYAHILLGSGAQLKSNALSKILENVK